MSEVVRRTRLMFLIIEMVMTLGIPTPRSIVEWRERRQTRRWERRRTRALPQKTRGYERLMRMNPGLLPSPTERRIATR